MIPHVIAIVGLLCGVRADKLGAASSSYLPPAEESASEHDYQYEYGEDDYGEVPADQRAGYGDSIEAAASESLASDAMNLKMLMGSVPGTPGEDYPIYASPPDTDFSCSDKVPGGYYADPAAECQAYHVCGAGYAILCPNGTIFNQEKFICDWWFNFDCGEAESFYGKNEEIAAEREAAEGAAASDAVVTEDVSQYGDAGAAADIGEYGDAAAAASAPEDSYLPPPGRRGRKNGRRGRGNVLAKLKKNQSRRLKKNLVGKLKKKAGANKRIGKKTGKTVGERSRNGKSKSKAAGLRKKNKSTRKEKKSGRMGRKGKNSRNSSQRKAKANNVARSRKNRKGRRGPIKG